VIGDRVIGDRVIGDRRPSSLDRRFSVVLPKHGAVLSEM
jgi:hypothetical protein